MSQNQSEELEALRSSKREHRKAVDRRIMELDPEITIKNDTLYFIVHSRDSKIDSWGPADDSWLFGGCKRGVRIVCDDDDIYVVATKTSDAVEKSAESMAYSIVRKLRWLNQEASVMTRWG